MASNCPLDIVTRSIVTYFTISRQFYGNRCANWVRRNSILMKNGSEIKSLDLLADDLHRLRAWCWSLKILIARI